MKKKTKMCKFVAFHPSVIFLTDKNDILKGNSRAWQIREGSVSFNFCPMCLSFHLLSVCLSMWLFVLLFDKYADLSLSFTVSYVYLQSVRLSFFLAHCLWQCAYLAGKIRGSPSFRACFSWAPKTRLFPWNTMTVWTHIQEFQLSHKGVSEVSERARE